MLQDFSSDENADGQRNTPELPLQELLHNKNAVTMISEKQSCFRFQQLGENRAFTYQAEPSTFSLDFKHMHEYRLSFTVGVDADVILHDDDLSSRIIQLMDDCATKE